MRFLSLKSLKKYQAWYFLGTFTAFLMLLNLSACGFHLKGTGNLSSLNYQTVVLTETAGVRADLLQSLTQQLKASGIKVSDTLADSQLEIRFQPTVYQASRTSLTAQGDTGSELIKMSQAFSAIEVATEQTLVAATANSFRDRRIDTAAALAANQELKTLQKRMVQELASQIIDRIARAKPQSTEPQ